MHVAACRQLPGVAVSPHVDSPVWDSSPNYQAAELDNGLSKSQEMLLGRSGYFIDHSNREKEEYMENTMKTSVYLKKAPIRQNHSKAFFLGSLHWVRLQKHHLYALASSTACGSIYCSSYRTSLAIEMRRFCQSLKDHNLWRCEGFKHWCPRVNEFQQYQKLASFDYLKCWTFTFQNPYFATTQLNCNSNDMCRIWGCWTVILTHHTIKMYPEA